MKRHEQLGFNFFRYCNENLSNTNEYNIARIIIEHIGDIKTVSLEQIAQEANISIGNFDNVGECQYAVPSHWDIGKVYKRLIKQVALEKKIDVVDAIIEVYHSFISDKIDDYNSSVYYENPSYIFECFIQNKIL